MIIYFYLLEIIISDKNAKVFEIFNIKPYWYWDQFPSHAFTIDGYRETLLCCVIEKIY